MTPLRILLTAVFITSLTLRLTEGLKPLDKRCCRQVKESRQCVKECRKLVRQPIRNTSSRRAERKVLRRLKSCPLSWTSFWRCVNESVIDSIRTTTSLPATVVSPVPQGPGHFCCLEATTDECRSACNRISASGTSLDDTAKVEYLVPYCGAPPSGPLWNCFLSGDTEIKRTEIKHTTIENRLTSLAVPTVEPVRMAADATKIQCCSRAVSQHCRDMCTQFFSHSVAPKQLWSIFEASCLMAFEELVLDTCIQDVLGVCKLGCKGLTFCQAFNNRPLQTFRQCTVAADISARNDLTSWIQNSLPPPLASIPLRDINTCLLPAWKALACVLQVKPCHPETHISKICYSDCMWLLDKCGDKKQMDSRGLSSKLICNLISPFNTTCIHLRDFISSSDDEERNIIQGVVATNIADDVTYPCEPNPCDEGFVCKVNRECLPSQSGCTPFRCVRGCNTDTRSVFFVERGDWVKVGVAGKSDCLQLCQCGASDRIESCKSATCGDVNRTCTHQEQLYEHGAVFMSECSRCVCFDGRVVCSRGLNCSSRVVNQSLLCENVICPSLESSCEGIVPPGRCCPICGTTVSFLVNSRTINSSHNNNQHLPAEAVDEILRHLKRLVNTFECDVEGFSSDAGSLVISVKSTIQSPRAIHVHVCNAEAQRLVSLVAARSPIITSNPTLEVLMAPQMQQPTVTDLDPTLSVTSSCVTHHMPFVSFLLVFTHLILLAR